MLPFPNHTNHHHHHHHHHRYHRYHPALTQGLQISVAGLQYFVGSLLADLRLLFQGLELLGQLVFGGLAQALADVLAEQSSATK